MDIFSTIDQLDSSISQDFQTEEPEESPENLEEMLHLLKTVVSPLRRKRGDLKKKITIRLQRLPKDSEQLHIDTVTIILDEVSGLLNEIKRSDSLIENKILESNLIKYDQTFLNEEIVASTDYHLKVAGILCEMRKRITPISTPTGEAPGTSGPPTTHQMNIKIPRMNCGTFNGEQDRLSYRTFMLSFDNIIGGRPDLTEAAKLQYLKGSLRGNALLHIEHLGNVNANYKIARKLLDDQYLDIPLLVDSLFHQLDSAPELDGRNIEAIRVYISKLRATLHELKELDQVDFFEVGSAGNRFLSHIVCDKLPSSFLRELKIVSGQEYPTLDEIFELYATVLKTMERFRRKEPASQSSSTIRKPYSGKAKQKQDLVKKSTSRNAILHTSSEQHDSSKESSSNSSKHNRHGTTEESSKLECFLCNKEHLMTNCSQYSTSLQKRERLEALGRCSKCTSSRHPSKGCPARTKGLKWPCRSCSSKAHFSCLCPREDRSSRRGSDSSGAKSSAANSNLNSNDAEAQYLCINSGSSYSGHILPTMTVKVKHGNKIVSVRALLDNGAQRTYFGSGLMRKLGIDCKSLPKKETRIKTFLSEGIRTSYELDVQMNICCDKYESVSALVDPHLDIGFKVEGLTKAISNLREDGYKLADSQFYDRLRDEVDNIDCLLGIDSLYLMRHFQYVDYHKGRLCSTCKGFIPIGPVKTFLSSSQIEGMDDEENSQPGKVGTSNRHNSNRRRNSYRRNRKRVEQSNAK